MKWVCTKHFQNIFSKCFFVLHDDIITASRLAFLCLQIFCQSLNLGKKLQKSPVNLFEAVIRRTTSFFKAVFIMCATQGGKCVGDLKECNEQAGVRGRWRHGHVSSHRARSAEGRRGIQRACDARQRRRTQLRTRPETASHRRRSGIRYRPTAPPAS